MLTTRTIAPEHGSVLDAGSTVDGATQVSLARTLDELEALRAAWDGVRWGRLDGDLDFFRCVISSRPEIARPHAILIERDGRTTAALAAWIDNVRLVSRFGYARLFAPTVRSLTATLGGVVSEMDEATAEELLDAALEVFATRDAEIIRFPGLPIDSPVARAVKRRIKRLRREFMVEQRTHHRIVLPETYDEYLATRGKETRKKLRNNRNRFERAFGADAELRVFSDIDDLPRIRADIEHVAQKTYQRALGVGFADSSDEQRALLELSIKRGWFRAYLMYVAGAPVAFWTGEAYGDTFYTGVTGYDPDFASHRVGAYVLCRLIEDLCGEPEIRYVDFGPGDATYKHQFGTETWTEEDVVIFSPTFRAMAINAARTVVQSADLGAKRLLRWLGRGDRVKTLWRSRLRESKRQAAPGQ